MKKFLYISFFFAGLFLVSCSKQEIDMNQGDSSVIAPEWKSDGSIVDGDSGVEVIDPTATGNGGTRKPVRNH
jgi:hypothetical protein